MTTIAVSGLNRGEIVQPGSAVINSIRRQYPSIKIVGLSYDPFESGLYSQHLDRVDAAFLMPYPIKGPQVLLERLHEINNMYHIDMIIPCLDNEIPNYIELSGELRKRGIKLPLVTRHMFDRRDKQNLTYLSRTAKIPLPRTEVACSIRDLEDICDEFHFPVFIKGKMYGGSKANNPQEAISVFTSLIQTWGGPVIVQTVVKKEDEYGVVGLGDGKGNIVGSCALRKIVVTATGKTFGGIVVDNHLINEQTQRIIKTLKWYGPFDLEFIKSRDEYYLIEMNPRFPAWVDFPSQMGCNLPAALVSMLLGFLPSPPIKPCIPGKLFMRHCYDLIGDISQLAAMVNDRCDAYTPPSISSDLGSMDAVYIRNNRNKTVLHCSHIAGQAVSDLTETFGSPLFVFDEQKIIDTAHRMVRAFHSRYQDTVFAWSYKTNYLEAICNIFHKKGWIAEVVSDFEYKKALKTGVDPISIIYNGPNKSRESLKYALEHSSVVQIDNWDELRIIEELVKDFPVPAKIGIRIWVDTGILPEVWLKFGFGLDSGEASRAIVKILQNPKLYLCTLHCHIGTNIFLPEAYAIATEKLVALRAVTYKVSGHLIPCINMGGGFPSSAKLHVMSEDAKTPSIDEYASAITDVLNQLPQDQRPQLVLETGRHLIDDAGYLITRVCAVKGTDRSKNIPVTGRQSHGAYVVDAGLNLLYTVAWCRVNVLPTRPSPPMLNLSVKLYGCLCMSVDIIREEVDLPPLEVGENLVLHPVGAYNLTQSMQFIDLRPAVVLINNEGVRVIRRREELADVMSSES